MTRSARVGARRSGDAGRPKLARGPRRPYARLVRAWFALVLLAGCGPRAVLGAGPPRAPAVADTPAAASPGPAGLARTVGVEGADLLVAGEAAAVLAPGAVVLSRLPAPHRVTASLAPLPADVAAARNLVGHRDPRGAVAFALAVAGRLTGAPAPAFDDGPALVGWAREQGAWADLPDAPLAPGDLVVFDRAALGAPASLVAVALATDDRGVTEILYLARGVVRAGRLDPARPAVARDREGRPVNSFLRHTADHPPPGTRYLAGELASGRVRLAPATRPRP